MVRRPRLRYAFRQHYRMAPWTDHMEVYWGERCQGYATAVSSEQVCVALASHDSTSAAGGGAARIAQAECSDWLAPKRVSAERGALTGNRNFTRVWRGNVALIGDASGTVDAITGEGLGLGIQPGGCAWRDASSPAIWRATRSNIAGWRGVRCGWRG